MTPTRGRPRGFDRDQALQTAMRLFWAKGYADTSMADLTAALGISSPSLYAAFGDKQALFREAVRLYETTEGARLWAPMQDPTLTARQAVEALLLATADAGRRPDAPTGCLVVLSGAHPDVLPQAACAELAEIRRASMNALQARLLRAREAGELAPDADVAAMAAFYATVHSGMAFRARDGGSPQELRATAQAAMLAWDGLAGLRCS